MTGDLEAHLRSPEKGGDARYGGVLRRALEDLLKMSSTAVEPLESRIESEYQDAKASAQRQFDRDKEKIERQFQLRSEEIRRKRDAEVEEAESDYASRLSVLKMDVQQRRRRVLDIAKELVGKAHKEQQDQLLVADFVSDGAVTRKQQKSFEAKANAEETRRRLDDLGAQAAYLVQLYRQRDLLSRAPAGPDAEKDKNPAELCRSQEALAQRHLEALRRLHTAQLFVEARPVLLAGGLCALTAGLLATPYLLNAPSLPPVKVTASIGAAVVAIVIGLGGALAWRRARHQVRRVYGRFSEALALARVGMERQLALDMQRIEREWQASVEEKQADLNRAHDTLKTAKANVAKQCRTSLRQIEEQRMEAVERLTGERDRLVSQAEQEFQEQQSQADGWHREGLAEIQRRYDEEMAACENTYQTARRSLEQRWDEGLARIEKLLHEADGLEKRVYEDWSQLLDESWTPSRTAPQGARFATIDLDFGCLAPSVTARAGSWLKTAQRATVPALLELPDRCSMLLEHPREGREKAIDTLRAVMMRLFASFPAGQVRFTILDPVGLGESFAGFMHAGDYLDALVGGRIWTEPVQIQEQLENLTQHMENVIQKYLRNEFETIEQYNEQAGELAEPYRFLVIADFPRNFNEETARRLSSIVHSGPRCGVHTLIAYDTRAELPSGVDIKDIGAASVHLAYENGNFVWRDRVFQQFPLLLDQPPDEAVVTRTMHAIGRAGAASARVEVPFTAVAPGESQFWSLDSRSELRVPLGRTGATRLQYLLLGRGVAQHLLIAGKTGSGKSTLLHVMITNLALWYAPDQVELYLIDFKQGVEFKTYATHHLPHARAIAIESDREFGLSILRRLDAEMVRRGDLFRQAGVQDLGAYRKVTGKPMPRTVLIVDEFQVFFAEDDKLAQDAAVLLEQLVRQGRAFGIHVVLGSQTLGGVFGLARSTIGQMAVRIALQCSEADSQLILEDDNVAARLLSRPGEAIYNDLGGRVAGNSPFQTAWLPDSTRDSCLQDIRRRKHDTYEKREPAIVFEGSAAADITENRQLAACLEQGPSEAQDITSLQPPRIWLGAPVTIKEPTVVVFRRQSGANVLIVGQRDDIAMNLMSAAVVALAAQLPPRAARFVILDGSSPDSAQAGVFEHLESVIPHECRHVAWRDVADTIAQLAQEVNERMQADTHKAPAVFVLVFGLQRYRMLRRNEDAFGLSLDDEAKARPDTQFVNVLREGPNVGIHVLAWADTLSTLERTLDRQTIREFDHRVLFQMSAADSSNLIDSPAANQLGLYRALLHSEEQGGLERFRPYAALREDWLVGVRKKLSQGHIVPKQNEAQQQS
jgi:S-DNA-T family DNA segregation ATPase FtsK/SpoIIIE